MCIGEHSSPAVLHQPFSNICSPTFVRQVICIISDISFSEVTLALVSLGILKGEVNLVLNILCGFDNKCSCSSHIAIYIDFLIQNLHIMSLHWFSWLNSNSRIKVLTNTRLCVGCVLLNWRLHRKKYHGNDLVYAVKAVHGKGQKGGSNCNRIIFFTRYFEKVPIY